MAVFLIINKGANNFMVPDIHFIQALNQKRKADRNMNYWGMFAFYPKL
jgi:hypothetical protein